MTHLGNLAYPRAFELIISMSHILNFFTIVVFYILKRFCIIIWKFFYIYDWYDRDYDAPKYNNSTCLNVHSKILYYIRCINS